MARTAYEALGLADLRAGDEWESAGRTLTEADIVNYAGLSGDFNPIHMDHEHARGTPFGKPMAHGLLGLAICSGLATQAPRVQTMAFLGILEWKFVEPLAAGDTIHVVSRVESVEPRARGRRGVVTWHRRLVNQHGKTVQEGRLQTLVQGGVTDPGEER
jgi:acyl dehydratase